MIGIVDYGMGNIASVNGALNYLGYQAIVTDDPGELKRATHIILPGVGSFQAAAREIERRGLRKHLEELSDEKPFLGICLGMQLLFTQGLEGGVSNGLDFIPGTVERLETEYILPHIGWNSLEITNNESRFQPFHNQSVYFLHSYGVKTAPEFVVATTDYGARIPAIVRRKNIFGMQFHPEKSGRIGLQLLETFLEVGASHANFTGY